MKNSVAALAIIASFAIGTIVAATPQVEAAGGWKEAFDQLLVQINVLEDKVQTLEGNAENCQNEFLVKQSIDDKYSETGYGGSIRYPIENYYELSANCESQVIPLNISVQDDSAIGTYFTETTSWYDEETGESGEQLVYIAECRKNFEGEISEDATFYHSFTVTSISVENDGTYPLVTETPEGLFQSGIWAGFEEIGVTALLLEKSDNAGISTPEELIGTFSIVGEFTVTDIYGNTVSDTATFTCSP